jgi:hypothetical protein
VKFFAVLLLSLLPVLAQAAELHEALEQVKP